MRRLALLGTLLALACSLLLAPGGNAAAGPGTVADKAKSHATAQVAARRRPTEFALGASGFGTRIVGGDIPAASGSTAWRALGCTNAAGLDKENYEAEVNIPGLGTVNGVRTRVWTTKRDGRVSSNASHKVAGITLAESSFGKLEISAIRTTASVWHDAKGYHARTTGSLAKLVFTPTDGDPQELDIPAPGQTITVPGLLEISLGKYRKRIGTRSAIARSSGLLVKIIPTNSLVRVASSRATMAEGIIAGLMSGYSAGLRANALQVDENSSIVNIGRTPLLQMPCQGTNGKVQERSVASVGSPALDALIDVGAAETSQLGQQTRRGGRGWERANVAKVELFDGRVVITGITAQANVIRRGRQVIRTAKGTSTLKIVADGEEYPVNLDKIEIPGLLTIEPKVIEKTRKSITVIALRIKLLDGTGATVDLGIAKMQIGRAVHKR